MAPVRSSAIDTLRTGDTVRAAGTRLAHLPEIHRLRGIAILMIVAAHCYQFFNWSLHPAAEAVFKDTFDNSSLIFMFVTGFLFQYTEERRFAYGRYLLRKLRNVLAPFAIALAPAVVYALVFGKTTLAGESTRDLSLAMKILYYLAYPGETMNYALWFMPVIVVYYLAAPMLREVDRLRTYWILAALLPLSILMHRPTFSSGHNLSLAAYFLSSYVLGMFLSRHWTVAAAWLGRNRTPLAVVFAVVFVGHLILSSHHGKSTTDEPFETQGTEGLIDWIYLQKLLMVTVLLGALHPLRKRSARALDYIAGASFTIFFYHLYFIYAVKWLTRYSAIEFRFHYFLALFALAIGAPCLMVAVVRKLAPRWSRSLIGAS